MKANKVPEKIWMSDDTGAIWVTNPDSTRFIEYTRTDAFIKKACEWLSNNLQTVRDEKSPSKHHVETIPVLGSITQTEFLEKFMKEINERKSCTTDE